MARKDRLSGNEAVAEALRQIRLCHMLPKPQVFEPVSEIGHSFITPIYFTMQRSTVGK